MRQCPPPTPAAARTAPTAPRAAVSTAAASAPATTARGRVRRRSLPTTVIRAAAQTRSSRAPPAPSDLQRSAPGHVRRRSPRNARLPHATRPPAARSRSAIAVRAASGTPTIPRRPPAPVPSARRRLLAPAATAAPPAISPPAPRPSALAGAIPPSRGSRLHGRRRRAGVTDAPLARGEKGERLLEILHAEVRPQARGEVQLRVSHLPEQKVAQALLAAGADQEVDVR